MHTLTVMRKNQQYKSKQISKTKEAQEAIDFRKRAQKCLQNIQLKNSVDVLSTCRNGQKISLKVKFLKFGGKWWSSIIFLKYKGNNKNKNKKGHRYTFLKIHSYNYIIQNYICTSRE